MTGGYLLALESVVPRRLLQGSTLAGTAALPPVFFIVVLVLLIEGLGVLLFLLFDHLHRVVLLALGGKDRPGQDGERNGGGNDFFHGVPRLLSVGEIITATFGATIG